jgi:hypothetical protein
MSKDDERTRDDSRAQPIRRSANLLTAGDRRRPQISTPPRGFCGQSRPWVVGAQRTHAQLSNLAKFFLTFEAERRSTTAKTIPHISNQRTGELK